MTSIEKGDIASFSTEPAGPQQPAGSAARSLRGQRVMQPTSGASLPMHPACKPLDGHILRVVPRYVLDPPIQIRWDTAPRRLLLRKADVSRRAEICGISLLGALVAITGRVDAKAGAIAQIQRGDQTGLVRVRRVNTDRFGATIIAVQFVTVDDALPDLHEIIRELRSAHDRQPRSDLRAGV